MDVKPPAATLFFFGGYSCCMTAGDVLMNRDGGATLSRAHSCTKTQAAKQGPVYRTLHQREAAGFRHAMDLERGLLHLHV